jgi:CubicO group peptidase (beta-lactamase class C family)
MRVISCVVRHALVALAASGAIAGAAPIFKNGGPDASAYGAGDAYPAGTRAQANQQRFMVGSYSHFDRLAPYHLVARPDAPSPLRYAAQPLSLTITDRGRAQSLADYLDTHPVTGLLVAKGDTILFEQYQYGRTDRDRLLSQSMAKTITAMLVGLAVADRAIASIDDEVSRYVPQLAGTEYGSTSIRALLHMSSGVAFREDYSGNDDLARFDRELRRGASPIAVIRQFNTRVFPPNTTFRYASIETAILGLVLRNATGMPLADYLRDRIWQPMGAEADATWIVDATGQEASWCCFNAVLRDYARFALLLAHDGAWNGRQIIPQDWVIEATSRAYGYPHLLPGVATPRLGYGYQTWILARPQRMFALLGIHGQAIYVDPASKVVLARTAVRLSATRDPEDSSALVALWNSLLRQVGQ